MHQGKKRQIDKLALRGHTNFLIHMTTGSEWK